MGCIISSMFVSVHFCPFFFSLENNLEKKCIKLVQTHKNKTKKLHVYVV